MVNSRTKGKVGEREWVKYLKSFGINARRGQQFQGGNQSPDVISDLNAIHWEVKRVEALNIYSAIKQAEADKGLGQIPVVAHRKNNQPWLITLPAQDFLRLILRLPS